MKPFIVNLAVYPYDIMVYFGEDRTPLLKEMKKYFHQKEVDMFSKLEFRKGKTVMFEGGQTIIWLYRVPESIGDLAILNHEIFHAVQMVMDRVGMILSQDSDEAYAYLIEYLTREIYKQVPIQFKNN